MTTAHWALVLAAMLIVMAVASYFVLRRRCPSCGRYWALVEVERKVFPGKSAMARFRCTFCESMSWKEASPPYDPLNDDSPTT